MTQRLENQYWVPRKCSKILPRFLSRAQLDVPYTNAAQSDVYWVFDLKIDFMRLVIATG